MNELKISYHFPNHQIKQVHVYEYNIYDAGLFNHS